MAWRGRCGHSAPKVFGNLGRSVTEVEGLLRPDEPICPGPAILTAQDRSEAVRSSSAESVRQRLADGNDLSGIGVQ